MGNRFAYSNTNTERNNNIDSTTWSVIAIDNFDIDDETIMDPQLLGLELSDNDLSRNFVFIDHIHNDITVENESSTTNNIHHINIIRGINRPLPHEGDNIRAAILAAIDTPIMSNNRLVSSPVLVVPNTSASLDPLDRSRPPKSLVDASLREHAERQPVIKVEEDTIPISPQEKQQSTNNHLLQTPVESIVDRDLVTVYDATQDPTEPYIAEEVTAEKLPIHDISRNQHEDTSQPDIQKPSLPIHYVYLSESSIKPRQYNDRNNVVDEYNLTIGKGEIIPGGTIGIVNIDDYEIYLNDKLGDGQYASVYRAVKSSTATSLDGSITSVRQFAARIIDRQHNQDETLKHMLDKEYEILCKLPRHNNILATHYLAQNKRYIISISEYATHGNLEVFMERTKTNHFSEPIAKYIFLQILDAVECAHNNNIVHRDIKLANILLTQTINHESSEDIVQARLLLCDWGFADYADKQLHVKCGSPHYAAPELLANIPYYGTRVDIWALGCLLYILTVGYYPFSNRQGEDTIYSVFSRILKNEVTFPDTISINLKSMIRNMLIKNPRRRISISGIRQSAWMKYTKISPLLIEKK